MPLEQQTRQPDPATEADPDLIRLDLPANFKYLNVMGACIGAVLSHVDGVEDPTLLAYQVQLAVHELCTNIVEHAYGDVSAGRITSILRLEREPRRLTVELRDSGRSFDPDSVPDPDLEEGQERGYGLFLVRSLMDEVAYEPQPGNNRWRLVKNV